ncbi:hypothetical protein HW555_000856 [Spodoptera exigua]|uniref:Uncharacterized protein n=1 Tax=Spodoptera exigua TaxID=7107 RepID=A0A835GTQ8_SPOEX|nr:hypothetical protein HW555_000856 [Spodoptera exigua]
MDPESSGPGRAAVLNISTAKNNCRTPLASAPHHPSFRDARRLRRNPPTTYIETGEAGRIGTRQHRTLHTATRTVARGMCGPILSAMYLCFVAAEMAHESGGAADGSPQHTPSPPHAPRLPLADTSFHQQIMQSCSSPSIVVVLCSAPDSVSLILPVVAFLATSFSCSEVTHQRQGTDELYMHIL